MASIQAPTAYLSVEILSAVIPNKSGEKYQASMTINNIAGTTEFKKCEKNRVVWNQVFHIPLFGNILPEKSIYFDLTEDKRFGTEFFGDGRVDFSFLMNVKECYHELPICHDSEYRGTLI